MKYVLPILILCILLTSCAQDDGTNASNRIYGVSASGNPIKGTVTIRDAHGNTVDCAIDSAGFFNIDISSLSPPFLLSAKGTVNGEDVHYYSYASTYGRVNINQLTHATVSMAVQNNASKHYFDFPDANLPDANDIDFYASGINYLLSDAYNESGLKENFSFMYDEFFTDGKGFDLLLDRISLSIPLTVYAVYLADKDTNIPIFVHDMVDDKNLYFMDPVMVTDILLLEHCYPFLQNLSVYYQMQDIYLWNNYLPELNPYHYKNPSYLLEALRYEKDRWSFIISKDVFDNYMQNSQYVGLGFYLGRDRNSNLRISFVYPDSPADKAGLVRGDILLEINGIDSYMITSQYDSAFGDDEQGEKVELTVQKLTGITESYTLTKNELKMSSILYSTILNVNDQTTGYLVFNSFSMPAIAELDPVFQNFKEKGVSELILDLRYNTGGLMNIAQHLASLIAGNDVVNKTFCKVKYNERHVLYNKTYHFVEVKNSLNLDSVIVITTGASCSASELLINSLKPYMDVVVIGSPTCGKPVGMSPLSVCDHYIMPVTNEVVNAFDHGGYYDGIDVDCPAVDDLSRSFGDVHEDSLQEALYYIENQQCSYRKRQKTEASKPFPLNGFKQEIGAF